MSGPEHPNSVKGPAVIGARVWLDARFRPGFHLELAREADPNFPERLLPGDWYPIEPLLHVLERSVALLDEFESVEQLVEVLAAQNARDDLRGIYRAFLWVTSPRMFLRASKTIWGNYSNIGTITDMSNEQGRYVAVLGDVQESCVGWLAGAWKGFLPPAIELAGGKNPVGTVIERTPTGGGLWQLRYQLTYD